MISIHYVNKRLQFKSSQSPDKKLEVLGLLGLGFTALVLLGLSWRKWCDPQIDFGREVYIPWRMANGAKWLKDVDDLYGPLSRFIDAGLFKVFGPGIMILAWANLLFYIGIVILLYILFRKAWGIKAALVSCGVFITVFSFSQLTSTSNYNYITPYSQQVTHGFFVSLLLLWALAEWIQRISGKMSFLAGLCWGLTAVLKPEFILAGGFMVLAALVYRTCYFGFPAAKILLAAFLGVIVPTFLFTLYIATYLPVNVAFAAACHAWLNGLFIWKDTLTAHLLNNFSGMDNPKVNAIIHGVSTLKAFGVVLTITAVAWGLGKIRPSSFKHGAFFVASVAIAYLGFRGFKAGDIGQCLLGLLLSYIAFKVVKNWPYRYAKEGQQELDHGIAVARLLLTVFAAALMTRMLLNGRVYQYGFFQAALAAMVVSAVLVGEVADLASLPAVSKQYFLTFIVLLLGSSCLTIIGQSERLLIQKTAPLGEGSDLFYTFPANVQGMGEIVKSFSDTLSKLPKDQTVVVIPEGILINYLARKVSPVSDILFYGNPEIEARMLNRLKEKSPDWVVVISRDLSEYGVTRYGAKSQSGEAIMAWVNANYRSAASVGSDPLAPNLIGGIIYNRNNATILK